MSDDSEITGNNIQSLPTEILFKIFKSLPVKDFTNCRAVCLRWLGIIDELAKSDHLWARHCKKDFSKVYAIARIKGKPGLLWCNLYRSLTLWQNISVSRERIHEFPAASCSDEEIRNFVILNNGVLGVHKKSSIIYYDIETLQQSNRGTISGDYSRYTENNVAIVVLNFHLLCSLVRKERNNTTYGQRSHATFDSVKLFTLTETALYLVNVDDKIFVCSLTDEKLRAVFLKQIAGGVVTLNFRDGQLNVITFQREIYTIVGTDVVCVCRSFVDPDSNLLNQLQKYNFLEQLDWRVYYQWMYVLNHAIPNDLQGITFIRSYGDVYFVGLNWGELRIYYAPYSAGQFDIFSKVPVKQYNFMQQSDCPVVSMCPILQVDVFEVEDGHTVLVAMPKKIVVLNLTHAFKSSDLM